MTVARRGPEVTLAIVASAAFVIEAVAWPLSEGRTGWFQIAGYFDFWNRPPLIPANHGFPPASMLLFGWFLNNAGGIATEVFLGACFVVAVWCIYKCGAMWAPWIGQAVAWLTVLHVFYGSLFHRIDSDGIFAVAFALWLYYALVNADKHSVRKYVAHGAAVFGLTMIRPANQLFVGFALCPLWLGPASIRNRLLHAGAFVMTFAVLLLGWTALNDIRYGEFGSRFSNAAPLYGLMTNTRLVSPANGPSSAALAAAIERDLVHEEPYRSRRLDAGAILLDGGGRAWEDLVWLSDRRWGWTSRYRILREVAQETMRRNPGQYLLAVTSTFLHTFIMRYRYPVQSSGGPVPVEGDESGTTRIPHARHSWYFATPDGRYDDGRPDAGLIALQTKTRDLEARVFDKRRGAPRVAALLNAVGTMFTPMILSIVAALFGLPFLGLQPTTRGAEIVLGIIFLNGLALLAFSCALQPATVEYRLPLDPLFILSGLVAAVAVVRGRRTLAAVTTMASA